MFHSGVSPAQLMQLLSVLQVGAVFEVEARKELGNLWFQFLEFFDILPLEAQHYAGKNSGFLLRHCWVEVSVLDFFFFFKRGDLYIHLIFL